MASTRRGDAGDFTFNEDDAVDDETTLEAEEAAADGPSAKEELDDLATEQEL